MALSSGAIFLLQVDSGWTWPFPVLPRQARKMERPLGKRDNIYKPVVYVTKEDRDRQVKEQEEMSSSSEEDEFKFSRRDSNKKVRFFQKSQN